MITSAELRACNLAELERIYREAPSGPTPRRPFRGQVRCRVAGRFARSAVADAIVAPFERLPFGIDFGAGAWFFVHPRARVGRFRMDRGRSRWRDTETLRLCYDVSRLPFRGLLYDEVKPLDDTLCLGLGGIDGEAGIGDLFFFVLEAIRADPPSAP